MWRGRVFAIFLLSAACGGTTLSTSLVLTGTPCEQYAQAWCAKDQSCTNGTAIIRSFGDMATCIARETLVCNDNSQAASTGDTTDLVEKCAQGMSSYSCTDYEENNLPAECSPKGPGANGSACAFNGQCATGFCGRSRNAICGACSEPPAAGESCAETNCGHGQVCNWNAGITQLCEPYVGNGTSCGPYSNPQCGTGLTCDGSSSANGTNGTCQPAIETAGTTCGSKNNDLNCDFRIGITCVDSTCATITYAADGQPCGYVNGGYVECTAGQCWSAGGAYIPYNGTGVCKAYAADGAACDVQVGPECMSGARCVASTDGGTSGTCTPPTPSLSAACK